MNESHLCLWSEDFKRASTEATGQEWAWVLRGAVESSAAGGVSKQEREMLRDEQNII